MAINKFLNLSRAVFFFSVSGGGSECQSQGVGFTSAHVPATYAKGSWSRLHERDELQMVINLPKKVNGDLGNTMLRRQQWDGDLKE